MNDEKPKFIKLCSDATFKYLWKNAKTRKWFVEIIKNKTGIDLSNYEFIDNECNTGTIIKDQRNDLVLSDFKDNVVIIEMNSSYSDSEERKNRYYLFRRAGNNYLVGKDYTKEKHSTLIAFNNYIRNGIDDAKVLNSWFGVHDLGIKYNDIEMYEIFLPNFYKMCYYNSNKIDKRLWMFGAETYDEMKKNITDKDDLYIVEELERLGMNNEFIDEYDYEIVKNKLINSYKIEGKAEGITIGEKSKQIEIAKKSLEQDIDTNTISVITGLSIEEINNLKD